MRQRWGKRLGRAARITEGLVLGTALVAIVMCVFVLWTLLTDPRQGEEWTSGLHPAQFYRELDADLIEEYVGVFAVAHNSGDTVQSTLEALSYGADVVEIDVVSLNGQLYAAHDSPSAWIGDRLFRGPPLERVWIAAGGAHAVKFDLKESSPAYTELVLNFLAERRGQRRVIVVSGSSAVLARFAEAEPTILRFLGISSADSFDRLGDDAALLSLIDGVSIYHPLIDDERAGWLEEQDLITLAWTVNNLSRVNELVKLGVDAITTDNLAIMKLLGGRLGMEPALDRPPASPSADDLALTFTIRRATRPTAPPTRRAVLSRSQIQLLQEQPTTAGYRHSSLQAANQPPQSSRRPQT